VSDAFFDDLIASAVIGRRVSDTGWIRIDCPLCEYRVGKSDRKRSFGFSVLSLRYECYRCEARGRLAHPPEEYDPVEQGDKPPPKPIEQPEGFYFLGEDGTHDAESLQPAWDFLNARGITDEQIIEHRLGACVIGRFAGRVIIPIFEYDDPNKWAWFIARAWVKKCDVPYLYPVGDRHGVMFNGRALSVTTDEPLLVMEGGFDAMAHLPNAVGALGKVTDDRVMDAVAKAPRPKVFVPDGDEWEAGYAAALRLRLDGHRAGAIRFPPKVDPDEVSQAAVRAAAMASLDCWDAVRIEP